MTLKDWQDRPDLRNPWKQFSKTDSAKALHSLLSTLGTPVPTMPPQNVDFVDWNASLNARREGFYEAIRLMFALAEDPAEKDELPAPWEQPKTNQ